MNARKALTNWEGVSFETRVSDGFKQVIATYAVATGLLAVACALQDCTRLIAKKTDVHRSKKPSRNKRTRAEQEPSPVF